MLVPFLFLFLAVEWAIHLFLLHRNTIPKLYRFHQSHHILFQEDSMGMESDKDMYWILIPIDLYYVGLMLILAICSGLAVISSGLASSFFISAMFFHILYDVCHTAWHITNSSLGNHHRKHHKFSVMHKFNMNVTIPVIDFLMKTTSKD
jgi:hypothetical protein